MGKKSKKKIKFDLIPRVPASSIKQIASKLATALLNEYQKKIEVADAQAELTIVEAIILNASSEKVAPDQEVQQIIALGRDEDCAMAGIAVARAKLAAELATIERKRIETIVSLTLAWIYSHQNNKTVNINT